MPTGDERIAQTADGTPRIDSTEGGKISGLRIVSFSGSRNPQVYEDWKRSVGSVRFISDLPDNKLAVVAFMSLAGEAKSLAAFAGPSGVAARVRTMAEAHAWLWTEHGCYAAGSVAKPRAAPAVKDEALLKSY